MADAIDSKSIVRKDMRVQLPPPAPAKFRSRRSRVGKIVCRKTWEFNSPSRRIFYDIILNKYAFT